MRSGTPGSPRFQLRWTLAVTIKRLAYQWRSLLATVLGILLAVIIGASIPLYTSAVGQVGLQQTLAKADRASAHIGLRTGETGLSESTSEELDQRVRQVIEAQLGAWSQQIVRWEETLPLPPERDGEVIPDTRLRLGHYQGWRQHVSLEAGSLPVGVLPSGIDVDAVASLDLAQAVGLNVGDVLTLIEARETSSPIHVRISGLVNPTDHRDPFWPQAGPPMLPAEPVGQWQVQGTLLVDEDAFFPLISRHLPETTSNLGWRVLIHHAAITLDQIPQIVPLLEELSENLEAVGASFMSIETGLGPLLTKYAEEARLLAAPFGLLIIQMGALTLYFLLTTAELVRLQERREITLIRSRGGLGSQVWTLRALEALIICAVAACIGPFVARAGLRQFGNLGPLRGLDIGTLPLGLDTTVFAYAAAAGLVSWFLLMLTLRPVLRAPLVTSGGTWERPERSAWWQRYYLDVALLLLGAVAYWQLSSYGAVLIKNLQGTLIVDPLLLLTPSLLMLAVGALLLRLFNPVMALLTTLLTRREGLMVLLAGWQVSRRPVHYGRIALMLALAIGMGWFATGFDATVVRSRQDRAAYGVGANLRVTSVDTLQGRQRTLPLQTYLGLAGVKQATLTYRTRINASTRTGRSVFGELLGVDPATFGLTVNWRPDLGVLAMPGSGKSSQPTAGRIMAPTPVRVGLWAFMPRSSPHTMLNSTALFLRVEDDDGSLVNIPLEPGFVEQSPLSPIPDRPDSRDPASEPTGWVYLEGSLTDLKRPLVAPLRLRSIHWVFRAPTLFGGTSGLYLANLILYDRWGVPHRLDWLDTTAGWRFLHDGMSVAQGSINSTQEARQGGPALVAAWTQEGRTSAMGIILNAPGGGSLPAVVSSSFLRANGLTGKDPFQINAFNSQLRFLVVAVMDYYPSLYADDRPFLVTDMSQLLYTLNLMPSATYYPNEAWFRLQEPGSGEAVLKALEQSQSGYAVKDSWQASDLEQQMQTNPLTVGLTGLFFIAFGVALILSTVSLLSYVSLTAQSRRVEFSVFQSLGQSARGLLLSLALEQFLVLGTGVAVGAVLGALLGHQILPFLSVSEGGASVVPPFVVQTGIDLLLQYALVMMGVSAILLLTSLWLLRRLPLARTLRLGDE